MRGILTGMALISFAGLVSAHPYATSLTNSGTSISFRLNEAADDVKIISSSGTVDLGALPSGLATTNLTITGNYSVQVTKAGSGGFTQISTDSNTLRFVNPRGVAVNKNPKSPYFGRVYLGNSSTGSTATGNGSRGTTQGIYLFNADLTDAVGQGATARTAGLNFASGGTSMPWRLTVGEDDGNLYICNWSDASGGLLVTDPNVATNSFATNVLSAMPSGGATNNVGINVNHGSVAMAAVTGSLATSNLTVWTVDEDLEEDRTVPFKSELNSVWRYDIGANTNALPYTDFQTNLIATASINFVSQTMGLARGTNGYLYYLDSRASGNEAVVKVLDSGNNLANVIFDTRNGSFALGYTFDICSNGVAVAVSPDQKYMAVARNNGSVIVFPLASGIPDMSSASSFAAFSVATVRDIAFDAADNLYVITSSTATGGQLMRAFSLGLTTTATTTSDGTFSLTTPTTQVYAALDNNVISEQGSTTATYSLIRTNDDLSQDLTVVFKMSGTATNGLDYVLKTNGVTLTTNAVVIPVGLDHVDVTITAVDDSVAELAETAILNINGTTVYSPMQPAVQTVAIVDNETPEISISATAANAYEAVTNDSATFRLTRRGDTNVAVTVTLNYTGTAVNGVDYTNATTSVFIDLGVVTKSFAAFNPVNNNHLDGVRTVIGTVAAGTGYTIGTTNSATGNLVDDDVPAERVLFSDALSSGTSSNNWKLSFMANNLVDDYDAEFGYDVTLDGVVPSSTGATNALKLTVNKFVGVTSDNGAAGLNLYPIGQSFSGNYAVRFNMNLVQNDTTGTTEFALFGINHSGTKTNWNLQSGDLVNNIPKDNDGLFYMVSSDASGSAPGDYALLTGNGAANGPTVVRTAASASFAGTFKSPPYTSGGGAGSPGNIYLNTNNAWCDVEIRKVNNTVTLAINKTVIIQYTNTTAYTNGDIMLGYNDPYASVGANGGAVYYSNVRVVNLAPVISAVSLVSTNVQIDFLTGDWQDTAANSFALQSAANVEGPYTDVSPAATFTQLASGSFRAVKGTNGAARFYRIRHQ